MGRNEFPYYNNLLLLRIALTDWIEKLPRISIPSEIHHRDKIQRFPRSESGLIRISRQISIVKVHTRRGTTNNIPTTIEYRESTSKFHSTSCTSFIACFEVNWSRISTQTVVSLVERRVTPRKGWDSRGQILTRSSTLAFLSRLRSVLSRLTREKKEGRRKRRSKWEKGEVTRERWAGVKGKWDRGRNVTRERIVECVVTRVFRANKKAIRSYHLACFPTRAQTRLLTREKSESGEGEAITNAIRVACTTTIPPPFDRCKRILYTSLHFFSASSPRDFLISREIRSRGVSPSCHAIRLNFLCVERDVG